MAVPIKSVSKKAAATPETVTELEILFAKLNKEVGAGTIIRGDQIRTTKRARISTGALAFDVALGGGWTVNSWHEIIGLESSGKTTMILKAIASNQEIDPNYRVFWVASEEFDLSWAELLGCDLKRFTFMFDNGMKTVYGMVIEVIASRQYDCVVIDSFPALVPEEEEEAEMDAWQQGLGARINGKFFRKARPALNRSMIEEDRAVTCLMVNQWRDKIGIVYGDPRTTPGGKGKNYEFVTRTEMVRDEWIIEGEGKEKMKVGIAMKAHVIKNKTAAPERVAVMDFYFDSNEGRIPVGEYDHAKALIAVGRLYGVVKVNNATYAYGDQKWVGIGKFNAALREDLTLQKTLHDEIMTEVLRKATGVTEVDFPAPESPRRRLNRTKQ